MKQPKLKASRSAMEMPLMPRSLGNGKSMLKSPSVTKQEIAKFWKQKRMVEEDHLSAAIKSAARKRAQNLSEHDYWQFESSLKENDVCEKDNNKGYRNNEELQGIIKDWWMKSEHSYLNEPIIDLFDNPRQPYATYTPQIWCDKFNAHQYMNFTGGIHIGQMV